MKKFSFIFLGLAVMLLSLSTVASAFTLDTSTGFDGTGTISIKVNGFTRSLDNDADVSFTDETWGIFKVTSMEWYNPATFSTDTLWQTGQDNENITGILYGFADNAGPLGTGPFEFQQIGGSYVMHISNDGVFTDEGLADDPSTRRTGDDDYTSITDQGMEFLRGDFEPGIISGENGGAFATTTVQQLVSTTAAPTNGTGKGYSNVYAGSAEPIFNTDGLLDTYGVLHDLLWDFTISDEISAGVPLPAPDGALDPNIWWDGYVNDPITSNARPVPEPTTVALLGFGLLGMAGVATRRKLRKKTVEKS